LTIVAGKGTEELQGLNVVRIEERKRGERHGLKVRRIEERRRNGDPKSFVNPILVVLPNSCLFFIPVVLNPLYS
jgi:hypothetical protein